MFLLTLVLNRFVYNYFNCEPCIDRSSCKCKFGQYTVYGGKKDSGECYSDICCCARERIEISEPPPPRTPTPTLKLPKTHVKKKPSGKFLIAIYMARFE
ncbi:hypothetical protein TVAGG3_0264910 [Trichomonas vaginalis G3]|uniref:hypothetical protein n=1 Tax=Trichomonas vaginalis (strain ATCC PRA-98 / G3) TaxID=412133 RepID=UPI0021E5D6B4|nr:hypothetical protein TVAGG3_0944000 [Trichomonas vaginalis G3]XP_051098167.1 hypothetical protein TVAGG3_0264910 [Trichomonas vaginalis G3]KAI5486741.1 hypothetical protein TVAGG3_0944000 [Trichomonas vaginalis G3]KAI5525400.1 hypothetical protein TVAGG3_0264910 [Trichomonas vaginalis G3]